MIRVAAIGECMIELQTHASGWHLGNAGDTFNTLWMIRALLPTDAETDFMTAFGDDLFSDRQINFFAANRIGTAASPRLPGQRPGLYAITLDAKGERSFTYWRSDSAARQLADDADALRQSLAGRDLIHLSGITLAILPPQARHHLKAALVYAKASGARLAFDTNWRPSLWPDAKTATAAMNDILEICDIALPSWPDEGVLFGDETPQASCQRLRSLGIPEVAIKLGAEGVLIATSDAAQQIVPAQSDIIPVDTTGAGDGFNGAYLAARLTGQDAPEAARIANQLAAEVIESHGALANPEALRRRWRSALP